MPQSVITNTLIASAGRVVNLLMGIAIVALMTRYLGPSQYGLYALVVSLGTIVSIIADFGLYLTLTREIARQPTRQQHVVSSISALRLSLLLVATGISVFIMVSVPAYRPLVWVFCVVMIGLVFQSLSQLLMGVFQTHSVVWRATVGDLAGRVVQLGGVLAFPFVIEGAPYDFSLLYMAFMFMVGVGVAYFVHGVLVPAIYPWRLVFVIDEWKNIIRRSWPFTALLILNVIYFRVDIVMLHFFRSSEEVGVYGLAYRIIEAILFFPAMYGGLLLPRLSHARDAKNNTHISQYLSQSIVFMLIGGSLTVLLLVAYAYPIIEFLSGAAFKSSGELLQILSIALFAMFFGNVFGYALVAFGKEVQLMKLYLALVVFNIVANMLFIPLYGALAAAWTTVATEGIAMVVGAYLAYRVVPFELDWAAAGKTLLIVVGTLVVTRILPDTWHIIVRILAAVSVYGAFGVLVRVIKPSSFHLLLARSQSV